MRGPLNHRNRSTHDRFINVVEVEFSRRAWAFVDDPGEEHAGEDPAQWFRRETGMTSHAARTAIVIGELESKLTGSIEAVEDGSIGMAHLSWMADTAERLTDSKTAVVAFDETGLLRKAKNLNVLQFRRACSNFVHAVDRPAFVTEQNDGVVYGRTMHLTTFDNGSVHLDAYLDREGATALHAAIDPLTRREGSDDLRDIDQRRGDALVEALNHLLDSGRLPQQGGQRPHLHVTTTLETLLDYIGAPAAVTETGVLMSSPSVQRLACDATIVRVLLNAESMVVDVGRAARVVPPATRRALNIRDNGCAWPGCDRSASRTQAHHVIHWANGGRTDLENLVLLCHRHHWKVHDGGWSIVRTDDGRVMVFAPVSGNPSPFGRDPTPLLG